MKNAVLDLIDGFLDDPLRGISCFQQFLARKPSLGKVTFHFTVTLTMVALLLSLLGCEEIDNDSEVLILRDVNLPQGCEFVQVHLTDLTQGEQGFSNLLAPPLTLESNLRLTQFGILDIGPTFNFKRPIYIRMMVANADSQCAPDFKAGQVWEFDGRPSFERVSGDERIYSVSFLQFNEVEADIAE